MKRLILFKFQAQSGVGGIMAALVICFVAAGCATDSSMKTADAKSGNTVSQSAPPAESQKLPTGAELYAVNCNRCHAERYPPEWNPSQWKTILTHMRVRANIPAEQARTILKYLQENAGS
jgi:mono/diheme cytochrome c family protein